MAASDLALKKALVAAVETAEAGRRHAEWRATLTKTESAWLQKKVEELQAELKRRDEEVNELRGHIKDLESDNEILCDRLKIDEQDRRDAEATRAEYRQMARGQL